MKIRINNRDTETGAMNLMELSQELSLPERGIAVALDNRMVRRDAWEATALKDGDSVIIIKAVCGG